MTLQSSPDRPFLSIGTRGSPLALVQAREVRARLALAHGVDEEAIAIVAIKTSGDRITDRPLSDVGGKGLFTKEIETALLAGEIDLAVHSSKDMPTALPEGLELSAFLEREDVRDVFLSLVARSPDHLPEGARIGTSSLRRAAQMKRFRPDFRIVAFRGNVGTRLEKLAGGVADATLLALAGLNRLEEAHKATHILDPDLFPPAPAQGAICIETRIGDARSAELVTPLNHSPTERMVVAERALLRALDGSCRTPIAALSRLEGDRLAIKGQILTPDGKEAVEDEMAGSAGDADSLGRRLGEALIAVAGADFLARFGARG